MPTNFTLKSNITNLKSNIYYEFKPYQVVLNLHRNTLIQPYMLDIPFNVHDGRLFKKFTLLNNKNYLNVSLRSLILTKPIGFVKKQKGKKKRSK